MLFANSRCSESCFTKCMDACSSTLFFSHIYPDIEDSGIDSVSGRFSLWLKQRKHINAIDVNQLVDFIVHLSRHGHEPRFQKVKMFGLHCIVQSHPPNICFCSPSFFQFEAIVKQDATIQAQQDESMFEACCRANIVSEWQGLISSLSCEYFHSLRKVFPRPHKIPNSALAGSSLVFFIANLVIQQNT